MLFLVNGAANTGVPGIGTDFLVASIKLLNERTLRIWYTRAPVLGTNKANDKNSYTISGGVTIAVATTTTDDPRAIDLVLDRVIPIGQWTVTFNSTNIISNDSDALHLPTTTYIFDIVNQAQPGAGLPTDENLTLKFLNPGFWNKKNWGVLVEGLETARQYLSDTANKIFDQCYLSSANGKYLATRASDSGIVKPSVLGLADEDFRKLATTIINDKQTENANLDLLEVIYGAAAVRANITSGNYEPYSLFDKATLNLILDGKTYVPVIFNWADFENMLFASAEEVCAAINRSFTIFGCTAFANTFTDLALNKTYVQIFSGTKGLRSSIAIDSGTAQNALAFGTEIATSLITTDNSVQVPITSSYGSINVLPGSTVTISDPTFDPADRGSFQALGLINLGSAQGIDVDIPAPVLDDALIQPMGLTVGEETLDKAILPGDYINILDSSFSLPNRGSFKVLDIVNIGGTTGIVIENENIIYENADISSFSKVTVWRPTTKQVFDNVNAAYITNRHYNLPGNRSGYSLASIPVNTEIITRDVTSGAYFSSCPDTIDTVLNRDASGTTTFSQNTPNNSFIEITGFLPKVPAYTDFVSSAGTPATLSVHTGTSNASSFTNEFEDTAYSGILPVVLTDLNGVLVAIGGRNAGTDIKAISKCTIVPRAITNNNLQFDYTWATTSLSQISGTGSSAVTLDYPRFYNKILIAGGYPNGPGAALGANYNTNKTYLYSTFDNSCKEITGTNPGATADAALVWMNDSAKTILIGGHDSNGQDQKLCSIWDPSFSTSNQLGQWHVGAGTELIYARSNCQAVDLKNGSVLVIGGRQTVNSNTFVLDNIGKPLNSCEILTPNFGTWAITPKLTGSMNQCRFAFGSCVLSDGRVLVVGGIGNNPSQPINPADNIVDHELKSVEIYDPTLGIWSPLASTKEAHSYCNCNYDTVNNRVYVYGGLKSKLVEYLDLNTMEWRLSAAKMSNASFRGAGASYQYSFAGRPVTISFRVGGSAVSSYVETSTGTNEFVTIASEAARTNGINGVHKTTSATTFVSSGSWTQNAPEDQFKNFTINLVEAQSYNLGYLEIGPYLLDKNQDFTLSGQKVTLNSVIPVGKGCPLVKIVEDTSTIPSTGLIVANYGFFNQSGPVKYSVIDSNTIRLDPAFYFDYQYLVSDQVVLNIATSKSPYLPTVDNQNGLFYLTASNAGLTAAKGYLEDISATGIDLVVNVRYPADRGLGNEGLPISNNYKLSEIIEVFGPDNLDAFLTQERSNV